MKWEKIKQKMIDDPEWGQQYQERKLELQRIRNNNPEVRRRHALACATWRDRKARGMTGRKPHCKHTPVSPLNLGRPEIFLVEFT